MSRKSRALDIDEDPQFQQKEYFFQRIGVALLVGFVLAALLGLTGMGGPLSRGEAGERGGPLHIEYERFVRRGGLSTVKLHVRHTPGDVRFWVAAHYFEGIRIESVAPPPELVAVETDRHIYMIRAASPDVAVTLKVEHEAAGILHGEIGIVDGPSVRFSQLAFF